MNYFEVEKEILRGEPIRYLVNSDGTEAEDKHFVSDLVEICLGFNVYILTEDGLRNDVVFYPVTTNTETLEDNSDEVLEQIKRHFPAADGWQCHNW